MLNSPQFTRGKKVEAFLDEFFRFRGWHIVPTTAHEERALCLGDRHFSKGDLKLNIEYKSGIQTGATGNIFLETISVDTQGKQGWVYTCQADYIFYAVLLNHKILVFKPDKLRAVIEELKTKFREVPTSNNQNKGYNTHGVIVPLGYAMRYLTEQIIEV